MNDKVKNVEEEGKMILANEKKRMDEIIKVNNDRFEQETKKYQEMLSRL
jgi:hypothetical protein